MYFSPLQSFLLMLKSSHLGPMGVSSSWLLSPFDKTQVYIKISLPSGINWMVNEINLEIIVHFMAQIWNQLFFQEYLIYFNRKCYFSSVQFSSVTQACPALCDPMNHSTPGLPVHHQLLESMQSHVHWVGDAIQSSHPLSSPSPPAFNLSQHQGLFEWVSSSHQVAKVLEFQLQHLSFQWTPRTDLL